MLLLKLENNHTINITKAHSPKTKRQRNPAEHILPTLEENVRTVPITMVKRKKTTFEWGVCSITTVLSYKAGLSSVLNLSTYNCSCTNKCLHHCKLHFSVDNRAGPKKPLHSEAWRSSPAVQISPPKHYILIYP